MITHVVEYGYRALGCLPAREDICQFAASIFVIRDNWKVQLVCLSHPCLFAKGLSGNSFGVFSQLTFNQVFTFLKLLTDSLFNGLRAVSCLTYT